MALFCFQFYFQTLFTFYVSLIFFLTNELNQFNLRNLFWLYYFVVWIHIHLIRQHFHKSIQFNLDIKISEDR